MAGSIGEIYMRREAVVKDYFYPSDKGVLKKLFHSWGQVDTAKKDALVSIVPHAGYIYSGEVAFRVLSAINIKRRVILMGPNHTGFGQRVSIYPGGSWETPFGDIDIDEELVERFVNVGLKTDTLAHLKEHSLEVILPILKYLNENCKIVPITISYLRYDECMMVAEKILNVVNYFKDEVTFVISSDFNHFEDEKTTLLKDKYAIDAILRLDPEGLYNVVRDKDISMCGVIPSTIGLIVAKNLGAQKGELLIHTTSGRVSGDYDRVVGYAGIVIS